MLVNSSTRWRKNHTHDAPLGLRHQRLALLHPMYPSVLRLVAILAPPSLGNLSELQATLAHAKQFRSFVPGWLCVCGCVWLKFIHSKSQSTIFVMTP